MFNWRIIISTLFILLIGCGNQAENKTVEISLNTIQCGMCSNKIADGLNKLEGIKKIDVDLEKKIGTVMYNASIVDIKAIENTIASIGYDANDTPADPKVYEKLDLCCKVPGG